MAVVEVERLHKIYDQLVAVDDISFEIQEGEIFGMVGPNGAGKTTTIECLEGLRRPDRGKVSVLGLDPQADGYALRERIGMQLQEAALPDRIRVWEVLELYASFYRHSVDWQPLLERFGLVDRRNVYYAKLSGGQKQRLYIALALLNDPALVFLDELTTGLDPQARRAMWDLVRHMCDQGKTVFLTTHFMEEAERLCSRVAIMDRGRIIALDTPENLIRGLGMDSRVVFSVDGTFAPESLQALGDVRRVERIDERVLVYGQGEALVSNVVNMLTANGVHFRDLRTEQPTLDDVFLTLTGREMRD
jgi:ABC-2 type transport system ATP-binding protein